jgi:hypothetical protein
MECAYSERPATWGFCRLAPSLGNQILAFVQCAERGIPPGPIATFIGCKDKGRYVCEGEGAIVLCMPVTCKRQPADQPQPADSAEPGADQHAEIFTRFVYRPNWFVLSQTEGQAVELRRCRTGTRCGRSTPSTSSRNRSR